jgi:hypothetical protein
VDLTDPYDDDTYRASVAISDGITFDTDTVSSQLRFTPSTLTKDSGSATILITENKTSCEYCRNYTFSKVSDGQSSFTVNLTKTNHTFKADAFGCVSEDELSAGAFDIEFYNGLNQYTVDEGVGEPLSYASDTYRASVAICDGITFNTCILPTSQLQFIPSTLTKDSGSALIQITDNTTSCEYCRNYTFSKVSDGSPGSSGVSILIDPTNQILSGSVIGPSFETPKPFTVIVEQNGNKFSYDEDLTSASTFKITNVFSGSDISDDGTASSETITPITASNFSRYETTFCVCYRDSNSIISSPTQQRHGVNITVNGSTGPGIVFTGLWEPGRIYQFTSEGPLSRRDAVLWQGLDPGVYDTYYATTFGHTAEPDNQPPGPAWEELGTQDFFVAAKIGIFEESYIQNTLNIGTNESGGISSANITLAGGTEYPYFSLGQCNGQSWASDGIWIGNDSGSYRASFVGDSGSLTWSGCELRVSGSIIATSGRFDGDVCIGGKVFLGPNASTPSPCVVTRDGTINEQLVTWQIDCYSSSPRPACWCSNIGGYVFVSCLLTSNNSNPLSDFDVVRADFIFTPNPQTIYTLPDIGWPPSTEVYLDFQITEGSNVLLSKECIIPKETIGIVTETLCYGNISKKNTLQSRVLVCAYAILDFSCEDYSGDVTISSCLTGIQPSISLRSNGLFTDVGGGEVSVVGLALVGGGVSTGGGGGGSGTVTEVGGCNGIDGTVNTTGCLFLSGQASCFHNLNTNGIVVRCGSSAITSRNLCGGTGVTIFNPDGVNGNPLICVSVSGGVTCISGTGGILTSPACITSTGTIGLTGQALALHNLATNGLIARTSCGNVAGRTITGGTGITVTNGDGVSGNPSISGCLGTVTSVTGTGSVSGLSLSGTVTSSGNITLGGSLTLTSSQVTTALGFTPYNSTNPSGYTTCTGTVTSIATNNGITGGTINSTGTIGLTGQALALHNLGTNGLIARTGTGTVAGRTITGTSNRITVTNGDGVSGNPTLTTPQDLHTSANFQVSTLCATTVCGTNILSNSVICIGSTTTPSPILYLSCNGSTSEGFGMCTVHNDANRSIIFFRRFTSTNAAVMTMYRGNSAVTFSSNVCASDFILTSDKRLKCNITPLENNLDKLKYIQPYSYIKNGNCEIGVIAQEFECVSLISVNPNGDGYLGISSNALPTILLGAVKELTQKVLCLECMLSERNK